MSRYIRASFPSGHITIELLQTPVVDKWLSVFNAYKELNIPSIVYSTNICAYGDQIQKNRECSDTGINVRINAVEEINNAIDKVNSVIEGTKFPYRAYEGMPWMQTNRLHRCFTTSSFTHHCWEHNLTHTQLLKCKTMGAMEVRDYIYHNATPQYKVIDKNTFEWQIHVINAQIHLYENTRHSVVAEEAINDYEKKYNCSLNSTRKDIIWNKNFTFTEDKTCLRPEFSHLPFLETITFEELLSSFPDNYEDYNVTIVKSIGGKDYETCYVQYDDNFEADIRNIEGINGAMTVYFNNEHYKFFTGSLFYQWAKSYGLRDEIILNVPIGKIIANNLDIQNPNTDRVPVLVELL